ncbi:TraG/VirB4 family ATPase [Mucilaginibacter lappiensis]|uniref:Small nuclear ribonucleoprotein (SnRNP)-like protein n=1 Tax=Mucilaginibacter lappiensis TaxID=354630 RepID=A0A841JKP0_9SPHI|nr:DUF87 domain-containing protein [Mucilaginibacter lappiensis]MBB6131517.1 small nuclear ribonucleoprotein (snRNP)-like protein [Mucilaginibacter lappiensis]
MRRNEFKLPYMGIDKQDEYSLLYGLQGEFSVVIKITNPVEQYSASSDAYDEFHNLFLNVVKIIGEGHYVQKHDVFLKAAYESPESTEYLQQKYNDHFEGRPYILLETYLSITRKVKKGAFYVYNAKALLEFKQSIGKVMGVLASGNARPIALDEAQVNLFVKRLLAMDFSSKNVVLNNMKPTDTEIRIGDRYVRNISLINIDTIDLPSSISTHAELKDKESLKGFPVDLFSFLFKVPNFDFIVFNQVIEIVGQMTTLNKLELKKRRHSGIPDPANLICVKDIEQLLEAVAKDNQLLVNCHFNIMLAADKEHIQKAANFIESSLFQFGITPSQNAYNQLELFRCVLPGNATEIAVYDWFLTTAEAALCFFFKEALAVSEESKFQIRFTDRQGVPIVMDPADLPMANRRITNRNKFVLGPSGTGKSFFMNAVIEQYMMYDIDLVIVDTGDSYSGLSDYFKGKYITYTEQKPITMNPFAISEEEYNIEKKNFLGTLVGLLWKGADGNISQVERDVIAHVIDSYYEHHFHFKEFPGLSEAQLSAIRDRIITSFRDSAFEDNDQEYIRLYNLYLRSKEELEEEEGIIEISQEVLNVNQIREQMVRYNEIIENRYEAAVAKQTRIATYRWNLNKITELNFNSFYEFAIRKIPQIILEDEIPFDIKEFTYVLKKFYKGGEFDRILNERSDQSLFTERFIVFEIDSIKEHKVLFPIVTLIIMDVFLQKMRYRSKFRKVLIIEEAWKAIASPLMASYLVYLYKTVRKFWGEAIVVTQELGDIIGNAVVKDSIINNSDTVCLLDQVKFKDNFKEIAALLSISEVERRKIFTINQLENKDNRGKFSEVYIRRGSVGEVYGVEVSLSQYLTYTTEKPEKLAIAVYNYAFGSYQDALDHFISDLKDTRLSLDDFVAFINKKGKPHRFSLDHLIKTNNHEETIVHQL